MHTAARRGTGMERFKGGERPRPPHRKKVAVQAACQEARRIDSQPLTVDAPGRRASLRPASRRRPPERPSGSR